MNGLDYFLNPVSVSQKHYEALRMYFVENITAKEVAEKFGFSYRAFTSLITKFNASIKQEEFKEPFFVVRKAGRPPKANQNEVKEIIIKLRKKNFSIEDIKISLDAMGHKMAENTIFLLLKKEGFARLPKRSKQAKRQLEKTNIKALKSSLLSFEPEEFKTSNGGLLCFLPYIKQYGIDEIINS